MTRRHPLSDLARIVTPGASARAEARSWLERLGRLGYAAKGVVYVVVGALAALAAFDLGGETTGSRGALRELVEQPYGTVLLGVVALGLLGYVLWRWTQAFKDTDGHGTGFKGLVVRAFLFVSGLVYLSLALAAAGLSLGTGGGEGEGDGGGSTREATGAGSTGGGTTTGGGGGEGEPVREWSADLLSQPYGRWLLGIVGAIVLGVALYQFVRAWTAKFRKRLKLEEMSRREDVWTTRAGRFGFAARGVTFGIIGGFLVTAALRADPDEAKGLEGALDTLAQQPFGPWLMGVVALGLVAYGLFQLVMAKYRRMVVR